MTKWEGKISKKSSKDWHNITLFSFQIEGIDRWFKTGTQEMPFNEMELIAFDERNGNVIWESIVVLSALSEPVVQVPTITKEPASFAFDTQSIKPVDDIGRRIQWQAARRDACNVMVAALAADAMPWAANLAKGKKLDALRGYILELTKQFIEEEVS